MSAPIGVGMLSTFLFQVVDTYFVGQLGAHALAALGFAATTYFLFVALFMGMAVGVSALVGRAKGAGDESLAARYATVSVGVGCAVSAVLAGVGYALMEPTFRLLGAGPELLELVTSYMGPLYVGLPLLVVALVAGAAVRAVGVVGPTEAVMALAGGVNVVLDYVLIFGIGPFPRWELFGAAVATVLSWAVAAAFMLVLQARHRLLSAA